MILDGKCRRLLFDIFSTQALLGSHRIFSLENTQLVYPRRDILMFLIGWLVYDSSSLHYGLTGSPTWGEQERELSRLVVYPLKEASIIQGDDDELKNRTHDLLRVKLNNKGKPKSPHELG